MKPLLFLLRFVPASEIKPQTLLQGYFPQILIPGLLGEIPNVLKGREKNWVSSPSLEFAEEIVKPPRASRD